MLGDTQHDAELESLLLCGCWGWEMLLLLADDEQNNKIIVLSSRGGASVISTSGGNAIQCAGLHHIHTAPGHISHSFRNFINKCEIYVDGYILNSGR